MFAPKLLMLLTIHFSVSVRVESMELRSIIDETVTFTYNCSKVIAEHLKPLCKNEYGINASQTFAKLLDDLALLNSNEVYVFYYIDSVFTNIPTINLG